MFSVLVAIEIGGFIAFVAEVGESFVGLYGFILVAFSCYFMFYSNFSISFLNYSTHFSTNTHNVMILLFYFTTWMLLILNHHTSLAHIFNFNNDDHFMGIYSILCSKFNSKAKSKFNQNRIIPNNSQNNGLEWP